MKTRPSSKAPQSAFTLIELLVVIAIIGIIGSFAVPAVGSLLKGSSINQAANMITDQAAAARQYALTKNRTVEVRFYSYIDPETPGETSPNYRAMQSFEIGEGGVPNPIGKVSRFPESVILSSNETFSNILADKTKITTTPTANDPDLPRGVKKNYTYASFRFLPDGSTSLSPTGGTAKGVWFITAHLLADLPKAAGGTPPPNFFTWTVDPVSGAMRVLRPGVKK